MNWEIKKIKNKNSNYDFRLIPSKKNDYSEINFFKTSYFRQLISISSYLTDGIIKSKNMKKISFFIVYILSKKNLSN